MKKISAVFLVCGFLLLFIYPQVVWAISVSTPSGPTSGTNGSSYTYSSSYSGGNYHVWFGWDWNGDGVVDEFHDKGYNASGSDTTSHSWSSQGTYNVKAYAQTDGPSFPEAWSSPLSVTISASVSPPNTPSTPSGPNSGVTGGNYAYQTSATDPDGNDVQYGWDWNGDGVVDEWTGLGTNGWTCNQYHTWSTAGTYSVKVKAKDANGLESNWSSPLTAAISLNDPYFYLKDQTSGSTTYSDNRTVSVEVYNDGYASFWLLSETQNTKPLTTDPNWGTKPTTYTFITTTDELKTVYLWIKDGAGNINNGPVSMSISLVEPARIWYVYANAIGSGPGSGTQGDPFKTINSAEAAATPDQGDEIHVRQGIYSLTAPGTGTITLKSGVSLRGGYKLTDWSSQDADPSKTVISGEGSVQCMNGSSLTSSITIENFTIRNGNTASSGGGLFLENHSATILNCAFTNNSAGMYGGGLCLDGTFATILNCTFINNSPTGYGGGGIAVFSASAIIENCTFTNNSGNYYGGGIHVDYSCPTITINNCTFTLNSSTYSGGGIDVEDSPTIISNCTFTANTGSRGGGLNLFGSTSSIQNSIIYGNSSSYPGADPNIYNNGCSLTITYSCYPGGSGTNIGADPLFYNAAAGDVHLLRTSPCVNRGPGDASALGLGWQQGYGTDPDGVHGDSGIVDMGFHYIGYTTEEVPPAPSGATLEAITTNYMRLKWTDNSNNELGFMVERKASGEADYTIVATTDADVTSYEATNLSTNEAYWFRVCSFNLGGSSYYSSPISRYTLASNPIMGTLTADSTSKITVNWSSGGAQDHYHVRYSGDNYASLIYNGSSTSYQKTGLTFNTQYTFRVWAANGDNVNSTSYAEGSKYTLANIPSAPTLTTLSTSEIRLGINENANPSSILFSIKVEYAGNTNYATQDGAGIETLGTSPVYKTKADWGTIEVTSLSVNTPYAFSVDAKNLDGVTNVYSTSASKYSLANKPGIPLITGEYDADPNIGYYVYITIVPDGNPDSTEYAIWSLNGFPNAGWLDGTGVTTGTDINNPTTWMTKAAWETNNANTNNNLTHGTSYSYRVIARNGDNVKTSLSNTGTGTTPSGPTPSMPTGLTTTQVSTYSAYSTWEAVPTATSYTISYGIDANASNIGITTETATHHSWTSLSPATPYYWKVLATNTYGPGAFSNIASFETLSPPLPVPSAPTGLATTGITTNSANSTWGVPTGSPTSYTISYGTNEAATNKGTTTEATAAHSWTSLSPATKYFWKVSATNANGTGEYSSIASFETVSLLPPAKPIGLTTTGITTNTAYSTWDVPAGSPSYYTISFGTNEAATNKGTTTEIPAAHSWTGLIPVTNYYWKVSATSTNGTGEYSSIASFETLSLPPAAPPLVTVEAPNGGQTLTGGVTYEIKWSATAESVINSNGITLRYSTDSGSNWNPINSSLPNTRIYSWEAAKVNSTHCRVSVEAEDVNGKVGTDMSDADFTISTEGVVMAPSIEAVRINGISFRSGNVISSNVTLEAIISSESGVNPVLTLLKVDNVPIASPLSPVSGNTNYGTWQWTFTITPGPQQVHIFAFHLVDMASNASDVTMEARIMGGGVQVIGTPNNYPNPFSPMSGGTTNIQYTLSKDATITIIIYDISGHEVKRMKYGAGTSGARGGMNQVGWNGRSLGGEVVGNGIYLYKIISGNQVIGSGKLVIFE